ncbi:MAG: PAS domain S-box protein [Syntrophomonas sp.]|nr:PAS domain S-box protein [Syntrophomonas sp.]
MSKQDTATEIARLQAEIASLRGENQELRLEKEKFLQTFCNNQAMMIITDAEGTILDVNSVCQPTTGYTREELLGQSIVAMGFYDNQQERQLILDHLQEHRTLRNYEKKLRKKSQEIAHVLFSCSAIGVNGREMIISSLIDITAQKKVEEALRQSLRILNQMFNRAPLAMIVTTVKDRTILEVNEAFLKINGQVRQDVVGRSDMHLQAWAKPNDLYEYFDILLREGSIENYETEFVVANGQIHTVLLSGALIFYQGQECILTIFNDITELRNFQREMSRLDNLYVIGQMSTSIAHEIRNPMTVVRGFLQMMQLEERYQQDKEIITLIIEELDRTNEIITNFLSLAKKSHLDIKRADLNDHIHALLPLLTVDALKNGVTIQAELGAVIPVMLDQSEFRQLLLNLVRNGIEAMPEGGRLTIRTSDGSEGLNLEIVDSGGGIPPEIMARIGTPFLTTKSGGTGLGLAVCYSIAERHKANMRIKTSPAGTMVTIVFPPASI